MRFLTTNAANNAAGEYEHIEVQPLAGALGATVRGIDLTDLSEVAFDEIQRASADHLVILFPGQNLTPDSLADFTTRWGNFGDEPFVGNIAEHDNVIRVLKEADEKQPLVFGGAWHSDYSFLDQPPARTFLYAVDVPDHGGDTLWTNAYLAWDHLSIGMQNMLRRERALHSPKNAYGSAATHNELMENMNILYGDKAHLTHAQPIARVHPETGRTALYINPGYVVGFEGWAPEESQPILDHLLAVATNPSFQCRYRWTAGDLAIWDNRCTMHNPISDYHGARRELLRTTVRGEVPVADSTVSHSTVSSLSS
jgi:taurine dioxygenase